MAYAYRSEGSTPSPPDLNDTTRHSSESCSPDLSGHFNAPGYRGEGLSLEAWRWNASSGGWEEAGRVQDDALNNFPPKQLPSGEWMMSRRDHDKPGSLKGFLSKLADVNYGAI